MLGNVDWDEIAAGDWRRAHDTHASLFLRRINDLARGRRLGARIGAPQIVVVFVEP
jgi:hypothetical protein